MQNSRLCSPSKKKSSSSADEIGKSIDILWEIFLWLPLKPLFQLKLVSKPWLTLISDQRFREFHYLHQRSRPTSLILSDRKGFGRLGSPILSFTTTTPTFGVDNLDFLNHSNVIIERCCNGFLLCSLGSTYFICNPITKDFTTLTLRNHPLRNRRIELYLAFDPSLSRYYKVLSVAQQVDNWVFNVYSFKNKSWISPGVSFPTPFALEAANGVYCNRVIHWCNEAEFSVCFDVDTLHLRNWPMPISDSEWVNRRMKYFGESAGRLHLVLTVSKQPFKYDIFELKEDYSGWLLRHRVDLEPLQHMQGLYSFALTIFRPVKEDISMLVLVADRETLLLYDPVTSRKLCDVEMGSAADHIRYKVTYGEILQYSENSALVEACTDKAETDST
ncbi:F-box protein At1g30790-like [Lotus japonicus]|uniref:F-box protein At1g30790-like n=1 Tax=Lotus japonicus TaxID=34305 RepID=UPI002587F252|nr:F-box protein At1g30790-like [Lotus japonicus]